jgi:cadmium resistance protein CadD (predicted permease)
VSRSFLGGLLLALGLTVLWPLTFVVSLPGGLESIAVFLLGVIPAAVGFAMLYAGWRSGKRRDPEAERLAGIKDQIVWRAVAQDGKITAAEAAAHAGLPEMEVELALMSLLSEGRASAEADDDGQIVYRVLSPV